MLLATHFRSQELHNWPELVMKFLHRFVSAILVYVTSGLLECRTNIGKEIWTIILNILTHLEPWHQRQNKNYVNSTHFDPKHEYLRTRTREGEPHEKSWKVLSGFPHNGCGYLMLAQEPIEIDHYINFLSDKSKHMAFKHSDWLETN